jgi:signal transduction histidine kinase
VTRRLILSTLALTVFVLAVLVIPLGLTSADQERQRLTLDLERDAVALASLVEERLESSRQVSSIQPVVDGYRDQSGARVVVVDDAGISVGDSDPDRPLGRDFTSREEVATALRGEVASGTRRSETLGTDLLYVAVPVASGGTVHGAVRVSFSDHEVNEAINRRWLSLGLISALALASAAGIGWLLGQWVVRPLSRLQGAASDLGHGDLTVRASVDDGPPEVRSLGHAFNDMATRLEHLVDAQEAFVADASHQLRTPLTALLLRLENLDQADGSDPTGDIAAAEAEVGRLSRIVDGLLALARADRQATGAAAEDMQAMALLDERAGIWGPVADDQGISLRVTGDRGLRVLATEDRVAQALDNLLANALEASPGSSTIELRATGDADGVVLSVLDEGPGLSADERARATDRFWRGRSSQGGSGLGLAIVEHLVTADGGSLRLEEAPSGGLAARIRLPAAGTDRAADPVDRPARSPAT